MVATYNFGSVYITDSLSKEKVNTLCNEFSEIFI